MFFLRGSAVWSFSVVFHNVSLPKRYIYEVLQVVTLFGPISDLFGGKVCCDVTRGRFVPVVMNGVIYRTPIHFPKRITPEIDGGFCAPTWKDHPI